MISFIMLFFVLISLLILNIGMWSNAGNYTIEHICIMISILINTIFIFWSIVK